MEGQHIEDASSVVEVVPQVVEKVSTHLSPRICNQAEEAGSGPTPSRRYDSILKRDTEGLTPRFEVQDLIRGRLSA
jgi:hypothetical protein